MGPGYRYPAFECTGVGPGPCVAYRSNTTVPARTLESVRKRHDFCLNSTVGSNNAGTRGLIDVVLSG